MDSVIYSGEQSERATATAFLEKRIEINRAYSSADFDAWLMQRLAVEPGEDILESVEAFERWRGALVGLACAEAFMVLRDIES